jgi:hypothetical protein
MTRSILGGALGLLWFIPTSGASQTIRGRIVAESVAHDVVSMVRVDTHRFRCEWVSASPCQSTRAYTIGVDGIEFRGSDVAIQVGAVEDLALRAIVLAEGAIEEPVEARGKAQYRAQCCL